MYKNTCVTLVIHHNTAGRLGQSFMVRYIILEGTSVNQLKHQPIQTYTWGSGCYQQNKTIEAGRAAYKRASFTFKIFKKKFIANITLVCLFNEIVFYFFIIC